ncbi:MAG TPA: nucleotidyltransferase domain-containing protein [Solirubrobacterales bacterium]|nr:nucleotidyltransferase domain-containing protein [Solirubrobacterales bacterium]
MNVSKPFTALSPSVDIDVLVVMAGSTMPRSGREVARRAGRSNTGVQHVLDRLVEHGLVDRIEAGRTFLYTLNRNHLLAPVVEQMAGARAELIQRLRDEVGSWPMPVAHASLFGSTARGDGDTSSDIDLFVVRPIDIEADDPGWCNQVDRLADAIRGWTGNNAGITEVGEEELPRLRQEQPPVVGELQDDAVDLAGESTKALLGR